MNSVLEHKIVRSPIGQVLYYRPRKKEIKAVIMVSKNGRVYYNYYIPKNKLGDRRSRYERERAI